MYDWCCCHSCDVERPEVGIARCGVFGVALGDKFLLDQRKGLVSPEHHS